MAIKSMKSKSITKQPKHNINTISYDRYSFILGGMKILTDYLSKQTKDILIKLYRKKLLTVLIKNIKQDDMYKQRYIVLTQNEAIEMIRHVLLINKREYVQRQQIKNEIFMRRINQQKSIKEQLNNKQAMGIHINKPFTNPFYQHHKQLTFNKFTTLYNTLKQSRQQMRQQKQHNQRLLRQLAYRKILSIQMELFVSTIVMIVQLSNNQQQDGEKLEKQCIVVFQQAYPIKTFTKTQLINIIGKQQYQIKILHTLKIYQTSITNQHFSNPTFITCHDCMRVVMDVGFPQHNLNCLKVFDKQKEKNVDSHFLMTPQRFLDKFINHQFFNTYDDGERVFQHPYVQYHIKADKDQKISCGRNWCGPCRIAYKKGMSMQHCDFCEFICQCTRCKKYEKFVQLLGHYMKIGGDIKEIQQRFVFNKVFGNEQKQSSQFHHGDDNQTKNLLFKHHLKSMYLSQLNNTILLQSKQFLTLNPQSLISGVFPQQQYQSPQYIQSIFFHKDQIKKKPRDQFDKIYQQEKKNYNKYSHQRKQRNVDLAIAKLDQGMKSRIIHAEIDQFMILKRRLQKSKIIKPSNPLTNNRLALNNADIVIYSQSQLKKSQRKLYKQVQTKVINNLMRSRQDREIRKVNRVKQFQKQKIFVRYEQQQQKRQKKYLNIQQQKYNGQQQQKKADDNNRIADDDNDGRQQQHYDSIWQ